VQEQERRLKEMFNSNETDSKVRDVLEDYFFKKLGQLPFESEDGEDKIYAMIDEMIEDVNCLIWERTKRINSEVPELLRNEVTDNREFRYRARL